VIVNVAEPSRICPALRGVGNEPMSTPIVASLLFRSRIASVEFISSAEFAGSAPATPTRTVPFSRINRVQAFTGFPRIKVPLLCLISQLLPLPVMAPVIARRDPNTFTVRMFGLLLPLIVMGSARVGPLPSRSTPAVENTVPTVTPRPVIT